jgi:hypothetical protein
MQQFLPPWPFAFLITAASRRNNAPK